jgi:hypothetical protein
MRKFVLIPFVVLLACTKHNPESCCSTPDQCTSFELPGITPCESGQVCDMTGTCVKPQCTTSADCTDAAMPFCENQLCVAACGSDADCTSMTGKPYCAASGACVACLDDAACTAQAPVCDGSANACRGCEKDSECAGGICLESNGTCADPANALYVSDTGSDSGNCPVTAPARRSHMRCRSCSRRTT